MKLSITIPTLNGKVDPTHQVVRAIQDYARSQGFRCELFDEIIVPEDDGKKEAEGLAYGRI